MVGAARLGGMDEDGFDLVQEIRAFDASVQGVACPACGRQAGWDWKISAEEVSMTCRACRVRQQADPTTRTG